LTDLCPAAFTDGTERIESRRREGAKKRSA
jgi:hypothetical protein